MLTTVARLHPIGLSLFGNPLHELPGALFESESTEMLYIGSTLVTTLPAFADPKDSPLDFLYMTNTQVSSFPAWFDGLVSKWRSKGRYQPVVAGDTPYCSQLRKIITNSSSIDFTTVEAGSNELSVAPSVLTNTSLENRELVTSVVPCWSFKYPWYWLSGDDEYLALEGSNVEDVEDGSLVSGLSISVRN